MALLNEAEVVEDTGEFTQQLLFENDRTVLTVCESEALDEDERYQMSEEDHWKLFEEFVESMGILHQRECFSEIYPELQDLEVTPEQEDRYFY